MATEDVPLVDEQFPNNLLPLRAWYGEPCMMGIDEAGRGPVLGPMVYAVVVCAISYKDTLATRAYADSKTLNEAQRSALFAAVEADEQLVHAADVLGAQALSALMLGRSRTSLNEIAAQSTFGLIQRAPDAGINLQEVYVDTVGDAERYSQRLSRTFPSLSFTVCPKADALYPCVSAASIVAKVTRDARLAASAASVLPERARVPLPSARTAQAAAAADPADSAAAAAQQQQQQLVLGTGYPGDTNTQAWLKRNLDPVFGFPDLVRFSWETATRMMEESGRVAKVAWEADAAPDMAGQPTLGAFLAPAPASAVAGGGGTGHGGAAGGDLPESSGVGRHAYFRVRRMQRVAAF